MTWHAAYTSIRLEKRAEQGLREIGIEAYVPVEKRTRRHARRKYTVELPILPRYLFFKAVPDDFWRVVKVEGIECIVKDAQRIARVPSEWVHEFRESERAGLFDFTDEAVEARRPSFENNDPVTIIGGPFAGQLATIMAAKPGDERVRVFLQSAGRLTNWPATVHVADLAHRDSPKAELEKVA